MTLQEQKQQSSHFLRIRLFVLIFAVLLIVAGTTIALLGIKQNTQGAWITILSLVLTAFGVILALFQWILPLPSGVAILMTPTSNISNNTKPYVQVEGFDLGISKKKGALVIYAQEELRGKTVDLHVGFITTYTLAFYGRLMGKRRAASNIVKRNINGHIEFAAIFPCLVPRNYSVYVFDGSLIQSASVTVYPGQVTEIDWR